MFMRRKGLSLMVAAGLCLGAASLLPPSGHAAAATHGCLQRDDLWQPAMEREHDPPHGAGAA